MPTKVTICSCRTLEQAKSSSWCAKLPAIGDTLSFKLSAAYDCRRSSKQCVQGCQAQACLAEIACGLAAVVVQLLHVSERDAGDGYTMWPSYSSRSSLCLFRNTSDLVFNFISFQKQRQASSWPQPQAIAGSHSVVAPDHLRKPP